jgi:hypothetical protein
MFGCDHIQLNLSYLIHVYRLSVTIRFVVRSSTYFSMQNETGIE